uniref:Uncharacterized protein n=1 Tax=Chromera velia CCMP2878 TaxID=1169474 RepID=A0A0G4F0Q5_9ALVE|eukprot:Cvel_14510.t1-p1 / transcript=Cvel_14510.t1 / gene=Cvel_14510 / organism=Chromera_velia_CCMP2878 / gene_product=hypothetical protein / transcript_product=hypothetical protein / location=Cvel_scaffold1035:43390-49161(-) / protein_length=315 / sequence_SO=supercontig / SO=protein_coding / is_pseudo=false
MSNDGSLNGEIYYRIQKAGMVWEKLQGEVWKRAGLTIKTKMHMFRGAVLPALLYGAETWAARKDQIGKLESWYMALPPSVFLLLGRLLPIGVSLHVAIAAARAWTVSMVNSCTCTRAGRCDNRECRFSHDPLDKRGEKLFVEWYRKKLEFLIKVDGSNGELDGESWASMLKGKQEKRKEEQEAFRDYLMLFRKADSEQSRQEGTKGFASANLSAVRPAPPPPDPPPGLPPLPTPPRDTDKEELPKEVQHCRPAPPMHTPPSKYACPRPEMGFPRDGGNNQKFFAPLNPTLDTLRPSQQPRGGLAWGRSSLHIRVG